MAAKSRTSPTTRNASDAFSADTLSARPFHILNCRCDVIEPCCRPAEPCHCDVSDYLMLYLSEGSAEFDFDGSRQTLGAQTIVLYRPGEPRRYTFPKKTKIVLYSITFTGANIEHVLSMTVFREGRIFLPGDTHLFEDFTQKIIRELKFRTAHYDLMCVSLFMELLACLSRKILNTAPEQSQQAGPLAAVLDLMHDHYYQNHSIEEYAELCRMSPYYFIRKFKEYTGCSPHAYLIGIRMEKAKGLLASTNMTLSEVSFAVGYENPLYFSRLFKKQTGQSPAAFKKEVDR